MFETAEVGHVVSKEEYREAVPKLRERLLAAQKALADSNLALVVLMGGVEGAGKSHAVNRLLEWMDARGIETHALSETTDEERERPPMWRFWRLLPARGRMAIFLGSWYTVPIIQRAFGRIRAAELDQSLEQVCRFETMLTKEGVVLVKLWLHLTEKEMGRRLKALSEDPMERWRVTRRDWKFFARYKKFTVVSERSLAHTDTGDARWHVIEATDWRYRDLEVGRIILSGLDGRLNRLKGESAPRRVPDRPRPPKVNVLRNLDLSLKMDEKEYARRIKKAEAEIGLLTRRLYEQKQSMILVFEGPDAAGKGGAIRRLTSAMDARNYQHIAVSAPTQEELAHPYLWRFWRALPRQGRVTIFDRSWYGRVLVERIEGFCSREEWERAFNEINAFEADLTAFGIVLVKFWVAVSREEQLRRFKEREGTPYKQYKITPEDWRNRAKWNAYEAAAVEMFERTSTQKAPWVLVEGEDKNFGRVKILQTVVRHLKLGLRKG